MMKTVNFKYDLDDRVRTRLGASGIITLLGVDERGPIYYVITDQNSDWWKEDQLEEDN